MVDLNQIVNDVLKDIEEEKFVEKIVNQKIKSTLEDIIGKLLNSYGDFGNKLKEKVEESLKVDFSGLGLVCYNELILTTIEKELDNLINIQGVEKMKESVAGLLSEIKSEYNLSELIQELKESDYSDHDYDDHITLIIEKSKDISGYCHIYIDEDEDVSKYSCEYNININGDGKPYSIKIKEKEINADVIMSGMYGLDKLLLKIYASGAKIILDRGIDPDSYEIEYNSEY